MILCKTCVANIKSNMTTNKKAIDYHIEHYGQYGKYIQTASSHKPFHTDQYIHKLYQS